MSGEAAEKEELLTQLDALRREKEEALRALAFREAELEALSRRVSEMQDTLETSRDEYADLYDFAPVAYVTLGPKGTIISANITFASLTGMEPHTLSQLPFSTLLTRESVQPFLSHLRRCRGGHKTSTELALQPRRGLRRQVQITTVPTLDFRTGELTYRSAVVDVTERKSAEEARDRFLRLLQLVMATASAAIAYVDPSGRFAYANSAYATLFGMESPEGKRPEEAHSCEVAEIFTEGIAAACHGDRAVADAAIASPEGTMRFLRAEFIPDLREEKACGAVL
ncbi:MAG TPA: PAS domain-containing protein, partial [Verrucomicrobiae bacterium]|nr:PAS domain-containing protein [Verrucomicrobiae bacterium]